MKIHSAIPGTILVIGLAGCSASDQEKAKEQAREDGRKISEEAKKAGHEFKKEANDVKHQIDASVPPDGRSSSEKASDAGAEANEATSRAGSELDQAALEAKVKTKLASDAGLSTLTHVDVAVNGSVVTLSGTVANESQKKAAEIAASRVKGVTEVQNRLGVQ